MHGLLPEELELLKLLENYVFLKEEQLIQYFSNSRTKIYLGFLQSKGLIIRKDGFVLLKGAKENPDYIKAFEVLLYYHSEIQNHLPITWPFTMFFMKNGLPYDIAIAKIGEEESLSTVINRSTAQRVIIVIEDIEQINLLQIEKPVLYFLPGSPPRLFGKREE